MNTNEEKMTLADITQHMDQTIKELHRINNMMKGAALFRDALIKDHPSMKLEAFEIYERVMRPLDIAFEEASKKHTELFDLSMGAK